MTESEIIKKAEYWLSDAFDEATKAEVKDMINNKSELLADAFYKDLEFGTGGLRGVMGAGTNRLNKYTIGMATQGLCNYLKQQNNSRTELSAAIAYDNRNNSKFFAEVTASVFSANGIKVFMFNELKPTPMLSFAIRQLKCDTGIVITASHNPKEYNGYKVYWKDGGQITAPHDKNIIAEVKKVTDVSQIKFDDKLSNLAYINNEFDETYIKRLSELLQNSEVFEKTDLKVVYTPLHGATCNIVPKAFNYLKLKNFELVAEQAIPDGNFTTVYSPNPEEASAFDMAIKQAKKVNADIIMGSDPDGDRLGVVAKNNKGEYFLLNGNQTAAIITRHLLSNMQQNNSIKEGDYIVKTIVTSELLDQIAESFNVNCYTVLTGFKYIAEIIEKNYLKNRFIAGGEESYGFLAGDFIRDKDAIMTCILITEIAAKAKEENKSLYDLLTDIYYEYGLYYEKLKSITKKGKQGAEEINAMMDRLRNETPESFNGVGIALVHDFEKRKTIDKISDLRYDISLPKSNVLQFDLTDGTKITVRPSGTEPKIKFYVSANRKLEKDEDINEAKKILNDKIEKIFEEIISK